MSKGIVERVLVTPDKHFPLHDQKSINIVCKVIQIVKPSKYIDLGDAGEWESVNRHRWLGQEKPPLAMWLNLIDKDVAHVSKGLDQIDEALDKVNCKDKSFCVGNHDEWLNTFIENTAPFLPEYRFGNVLHLKNRGYKVIPCGQRMRYGKLYFYHGHLYGGLHHDTNHLRKLGVNIMYGHWHDIKYDSITHEDGQKGAWSIGCLKRIEPKYNQWLGNRPVNWGLGFAIVDFFDGGLFTVHVIQIIKGKCSLWGEVIHG